LDEIDRIIFRNSITHVLELDITSYFDSIVRKHLMAMIEQRVNDGSILKLIRKWVQVGIIDKGQLLETEDGVGQGQVISPFLANVYLHHVLDQWFEREVKPRLKGSAFLVRYMDDAVICFQNVEDAQRVHKVLDKRFSKYGLKLHPDKTRLVEFGSEALIQAKQSGRKPATFDFLGFTHIAARSRRGHYMTKVKTMKKRLRRSLKAVTVWCKEHRHKPMDVQHLILNAKLRGHYQYYGRSSNYRSLRKFYSAVRRIWKTWLNRRTRGTTLNWDTYVKLLQRYPLLMPRLSRPWVASRSPA
jgi:group II intron reverse transcriptase/maturase